MDFRIGKPSFSAFRKLCWRELSTLSLSFGLSRPPRSLGPCRDRHSLLTSYFPPPLPCRLLCVLSGGVEGARFRRVGVWYLQCRRASCQYQFPLFFPRRCLMIKTVWLRCASSLLVPRPHSGKSCLKGIITFLFAGSQVFALKPVGFLRMFEILAQISSPFPTSRILFPSSI